MKKDRQSIIKKIIKSNEIQTQEELQEYMKNAGFNITQATISRDIKELKIIKLPISPTKSIYAFNDKGHTNNSSFDIGVMLKSSVKSIDTAANLVVVKCYSGMANSACAIIDNLSNLQIVGTLAGDDTIFLATKSEEIAHQIEDFLNDLI
ncbi:MAG: arginine repressor [Clostridia bacterium]